MMSYLKCVVKLLIDLSKVLTKFHNKCKHEGKKSNFEDYL